MSYIHERSLNKVPIIHPKNKLVKFKGYSKIHIWNFKETQAILKKKKKE